MLLNSPYSLLNKKNSNIDKFKDPKTIIIENKEQKRLLRVISSLYSFFHLSNTQ